MVYVITSFSDSSSGLAFPTNLHLNSTILACQYIEPSGGTTETLKDVLERFNRCLSGSDAELTNRQPWMWQHSLGRRDFHVALFELDSWGRWPILAVIHSRSVIEIALNLQKASKEGASSTLFLIFRDLLFKLDMGWVCAIEMRSSGSPYV